MWNFRHLLVFCSVGNCCKQREALNLKEHTYSLWGYLAVSVSQDDQFVNPLYERTTSKQVLSFRDGIIIPQNIKFWRGLYCRFESGAHPRECLLDLLTITQNHTTSLEDHGRQLTKTIGYYTEKIGAAKMLRSIMQNPGSGATSSAGATQKTGTAFEGSQSSSVNMAGSEIDEAACEVQISPSYEELAEEAMADSDIVPDAPPASTSSLQQASKMHPLSTAASHPLESELSSEFEQIEKKFTNLKTSLVEKCQSSM